jgi:hypothetical protein
MDDSEPARRLAGRAESLVGATLGESLEGACSAGLVPWAVAPSDAGLTASSVCSDVSVTVISDPSEGGPRASLRRWACHDPAMVRSGRPGRERRDVLDWSIGMHMSSEPTQMNSIQNLNETAKPNAAASRRAKSLRRD